MSQPMKRGRRSHVTSTRQSAPTPLEFFITASLGDKESKKISVIKLPCTLAELAYEVANISFVACEELAFKAGIVFSKSKEIQNGDRPETEKIPF